MAVIHFYEKSGCSGNARQKAVLEASGHDVVSKDLRHVAWTRLRLLRFFEGVPVANWFNRSAPAVKSGEIVPEELDEATALGLLQNNPLLIRRPLLEIGPVRLVGFDVAALNELIGLSVADGDDDFESCRHGDDPAHRCRDPLAT